MPKCDFNKVAIMLWHGCSPVNLPHIFRTPFLKNTSGRLLLKYYLKNKNSNQSFAIFQSCQNQLSSLLVTLKNKYYSKVTKKLLLTDTRYFVNFL